MIDERKAYLAYDPECTGYPADAPYHPAVRYPEYPFSELASAENGAYEMIRNVLHQMGLDHARFGTAAWNPLGEVIKPGSKVILKPNFVSHINYGYRDGITDTDCLVTHGSVVRAIADYVAIALQGKGTIVLGDSPIQPTDWQEMMRVSGVDRLGAFYASKGITFRTEDFRLVQARIRGGFVRDQESRNNVEDYLEVDLARESLLMPIIADWEKFAVSEYDFDRMRRVHNKDRNAYLFPKEVLSADCVINIPKLKFHLKAGITCSLKNLVGVIGHKDYLPHFRLGGPNEGSDEYPARNFAEPAYWGILHQAWKEQIPWKKALLQNASRVVGLPMSRNLKWQGAGGWHGNDTLWRTVLDINRAFFYWDVDSGRLAERPQRQYLTIIDGIIGGENNSPLAPSPRAAHCVIAGRSPVATDLVAAVYMGLDFQKIPVLSHSCDNFRYPLANYRPRDISVVVNGQETTFEDFSTRGPIFPFKPPEGWEGFVESARARDAFQSMGKAV